VVSIAVTRTRFAVMVVTTLLAWATHADAAVTARVDRNTIDLNESFLLEVIVDFDTDLEPDVATLEQDFIVGQPSQLSNTTIINGQISRSYTWTYPLMAKSVGRFEIPPIGVGTESSQPIVVTVREPADAPPGEADVFITSEVDFDETYVQAQVLYRIKVYRAVSTRQPALRDPVFGGAEVLVEIAGDERSYQAILNNRDYNVVERVYALFPQESGEITISPARFEARVLRDGRITGRKVFESEPQTIKVLPIPPRPAEFPNAAWLPARDLALEESWSRDPGELKAGEPITRIVTVSALGQLETQIPATEAPDTDGVNVYPDRPELSRQVETAGIRGVRRDQYAMIGVSAGDVTLPGLKLPWWDVTSAQWRVAELPERTIRILPTGEPPPPEPQAVEAAEDTTDAAAAGAVEDASPNLWRRVSELLAIVWLLTLVAWWWSSREPRDPREPTPPPLHQQQARHLKAARKAALDGDAAGVRRAMLEWGRLQWPQAAPRSIGALAARVSAPLADELTQLANSSYGPNGAGWDGEALAKALRSFATVDESTARARDDLLPPLMP